LVFRDGERLDHLVVRQHRLPVAQVLRFGLQLAMSLAAAHRHGVLHRDLKPDNVLVVSDPAVDGGLRAKLLDFGICKLMNVSNVRTTHDGVTVGTPTYMSPEQCRGRDDLDARSDVYALGCVLYFMLTGQPVFRYRSTGELLAAHLAEKPVRASALNPDVAPGLDDLLARCLAKEATRRVASMTALGDELSALQRAHAADGSPTVPTRRARFLAWGRRAVVLAFAALALSAAASSGGACVSNSGGVRACTTSDPLACL
jgi:serine/threonine-protein kinase